MQRHESQPQNPPRLTLCDDTAMVAPFTTTLLNLVAALQECTPNDVELVATLAFLINSGRVRLCGTFAGARIDLAPEAGAVPFALPWPPRRLEGRRRAGAASAVGTRLWGRAARALSS